MTNTYVFPIEICQCEDSNVCHNHSPANDPHAANCNCALCVASIRHDAVYAATVPNDNPYNEEPEWFQEPKVCRDCNDKDCAANDDGDNRITRCHNLHSEDSNRMLNANVPHAGKCRCDECESVFNDPLAPEPHSYTNPNLCYECDTKV
jgi:hypothetical protein